MPDAKNADMTMALRKPLTILLGAALALGACGKDDAGPVRAVVIGQSMKIADPTAKGSLQPADAVLHGAAAEGLVRFDAGGQIVPGLAERWNVSDDGLSYIFRLGDRRWSDGTRVTARFVVRRLRAAAAPQSRNPLAMVLSGIEEIVATTDDVLEIRLTAPRPNLLYHLASPELAVVRDDGGAGPFAVERRADDSLLLSRTIPDGEGERRESLALRTARSAVAVTLFTQRQADLVLGGTWGDLPVARAADPRAAALRLDPAAGFFGLAVVDPGGPLKSAEVRRAISMALDRDAIVAAMAIQGLQPRATLAPADLSNLAAPAAPSWAPAPLALRQAEARRLITTPVRLRVALPDGPGYTLLFAHLKRDWAVIGVEAERVAMPGNADLRLLDAVAPSRGASWYFEQFTCERAAVCDATADAAIESARIARDAPTRANYFAEADRQLADAAIFIPLTAPVRWSLVAPRINGFRPNPFAVHNLTDLLEVRRR